MYFSCVKIISPWNRVGLSIWKNLNPLLPRMLCAKYDWKWSTGSWEEICYFVNLFFLFCNFLSFEKGDCISFEQTWTPFTQRCFLPSLVVIGSLVFEKKILNFFHVFLIPCSGDHEIYYFCSLFHGHSYYTFSCVICNIMYRRRFLNKYWI